MDPTSTHFNFSLNLFIGYFWNCNWWVALRRGFKWMFWIVKENSYYAYNGVNGTFFGPKSIMLKYSSIMVIKFFGNCTRWIAFKIGQKQLLWILKENSYLAQNEVNWSIIETWVHCYLAPVKGEVGGGWAKN